MMTFLMNFFLTVSSFASEDSLENGFAGISAIFFLASYYNVAIRTTGLLFLWPSGEDAVPFFLFRVRTAHQLKHDLFR